MIGKVFMFCTLVGSAVLGGPAYSKDYLKSEFAQPRGYSDAVVTEGGKTVWLAGHAALRDEQGKTLSGDVKEQARVIFRAMDRVLKRAGGNLQDLTTITVYLTDPRYLALLAPIRQEFFPDGNFPASTTITVSSLPEPGMLVEIQGTAVIDKK
jgi:2-iminobutanoate/2-iminopropanoate deaminase